MQPEYIRARERMAAAAERVNTVRVTSVKLDTCRDQKKFIRYGLVSPCE